LARAKRTDRAEARRRHRAATAATEGGAEAGSTTAQGRATTSSSGAVAMSSPAGRVSMGTAFRQSFHPVDVRADLAALPWLAVHTKALWIPVLLTLGASVAVAVSTVMSSVGVISALLFQYFVQPPAIGGVFIAGFLAPRASWLLGVIVGLVSATAYAILVLAFPTAITGTTPDAAQATQLVLSGFLLAPVFGALFASGAAWYRRFLQLSSPNRGRRAEAKKKTNDGKSRTSGRDQKSGARR
jgi:hypothetical protein